MMACMNDAPTFSADEHLIAHYLSPIAGYLGIGGDMTQCDGVAEVMVNRFDDIWIEKHGKVMRAPEKMDEQSLENFIVKLTNMTNNIGGRGAIINVYWHGLRISATMSPTSFLGDSLSIRRKVKTIVPLEGYANNATFTAKSEIPDPKIRSELLVWLETLVKARKTILVSGGTSSGKTTFLNALLSRVPEHERLLTIEDSPELEPTAPNLVRMVSSEALHITPRDLIRQSLRYRPDRVIVGEVRGAEALDMLDACNTGHDGSMTSIHANNPLSALGRLETLVLRAGVNWPHAAIRQTIADSIDYVIQMRRSDNGDRVISDILALEGYDAENHYLYRHIRPTNTLSAVSTSEV
jgi:Flp pilus assembly CpaF family ATPase